MNSRSIAFIAIIAITAGGLGIGAMSAHAQYSASDTNATIYGASATGTADTVTGTSSMTASSTAPGVPNTGAGGAASNTAILLVSGAAALGAAGYLVRSLAFR